MTLLITAVAILEIGFNDNWIIERDRVNTGWPESIGHQLNEPKKISIKFYFRNKKIKN